MGMLQPRHADGVCCLHPGTTTSWPSWSVYWNNCRLEADLVTHKLWGLSFARDTCSKDRPGRCELSDFACHPAKARLSHCAHIMNPDQSSLHRASYESGLWGYLHGAACKPDPMQAAWSSIETGHQVACLDKMKQMSRSPADLAAMQR